MYFLVPQHLKKPLTKATFLDAHIFNFKGLSNLNNLTVSLNQYTPLKFSHKASPLVKR